MRSRKLLLTASSLIVAAGLLPFAGCGNSVPPTGAATVCAQGAAQIAVGDGYLQSQCGCAEGSQLVASGTPLNCTVTSGSFVIFEYPATRLKHQIIPTSTTSVIPASPLSDPADRIPTRVYAFVISPAGTYPFEDAFDNGMSGNIIVH